MRNLKLTICLSAALSSAAAYAQVISPDVNGDAQAATSSSPVAYVYVASTPANSKTNQIVAYTAAANGSLSPVTGSPFPDNVSSMAVNGKYLMASNAAKTDIDTFKIESDGAITYAASIDYSEYNDPPYDCGGAGQIFFDHTGATLYVMEFNGSNACTNTVYASFAVVKATGELKYLGLANVGVFPGVNSAAYFIGNNVYAYTADDSACMYYSFYGLKRRQSGLLSLFNFQANLPPPPSGVHRYVPALAAADPTNHLAFTMQPANPPGCASGPLQLASYTADSNGNLKTTNTHSNMPATLISSPYDMKMAPSGKLLAVAGQEGLQIFHFNGASPITHYTGLLTSDPINQMFWDNNNHLYAISQNSGKLFVFTITPTGHQEAPGSPYTISSPQDIIVRPL
jgi:6-phosphogluconolactonase (cycloisomerase 2 family)